MEIRDRIAVVTGGASGIGRALVDRFHADGARHLVVVDRDSAGAEAVAERVGGSAAAVDVADEGAVRALVESVERDRGPIGLFVSNAGYVTAAEIHGRGLEAQREHDARGIRDVVAKIAAATHPDSPPCPDCKGSGQYIGLATDIGPCKCCGGSGRVQ